MPVSVSKNLGNEIARGESTGGSIWNLNARYKAK